jgi:hypothetical protein
MKSVKLFSRLFAAGLVFVLACPAVAINVVVDYSYDSNGFFGAGNPQGAASGAQAKAALDTAASYFSTILNDTFSAIVTPPTFHSSVFDGQVTWEWTASFTHPGNGSSVVLTNPPVPANEYRIYAGARNLSGSTAGVGGPGGFGWSSNPSGGFTSGEIDQIDAITDTFSNQVENREEASGFAAWGGVITFDRDGSTTWHYNHTTAPVGAATDFYSVVVHELTHAFGFGTATEFQSLVHSGFFHGTNAIAAHGGAVPMSGTGHWAFNTSSTVYGTSMTQEAAMDPDVLNGTRKLFTTLDGAALTDIGWELVAPPAPTPTGDYNGNGKVDAADYVAWRNTNGQSASPAGSGADGDENGTVGPGDYTFWRSKFGLTVGSGSFVEGGSVPEPTAATLIVLGGLSCSLLRRNRC